MAMVNCGECGKEVSDKAASCPHCGGDRVGLPLEVKVVDIEMTFMSMVFFMVKAVFAAIPAAILVLVLGGLMTGVVATMLRR